jgi:hypothetical protein
VLDAYAAAGGNFIDPARVPQALRNSNTSGGSAGAKTARHLGIVQGRRELDEFSFRNQDSILVTVDPMTRHEIYAGKRNKEIARSISIFLALSRIGP